MAIYTRRPTPGLIHHSDRGSQYTSVEVGGRLRVAGMHGRWWRGLGPGMLWSYGLEAQALAVGTTGGGPDVPGHPQFSSLSWEEFTRDLRLARHFSGDVYVHSLEGCVRQGYLRRLRSFDWGAPVTHPKTARLAEGIRALLRVILRASTHPWRVLGVSRSSAYAEEDHGRGHTARSQLDRANMAHFRHRFGQYLPGQTHSLELG